SINNYAHLALVSGGYKYNNESGIAISQLGNEELSWESTWATNVALHLGFIDRINLDVEFYNKKTTNMLMAVPISYTTSGFGTRWDNVGAMRNRGVEINVSADVLRIKDFTWNVNANVSYNKNEITELYNGITEYVASDTGRMVAVGHPLGEFYLNRYAGVNPTNGDALWYTKDGEITTEYNESDKVMLGKTHEAPWQGGFGTTLSWQGFSLSAQFTWVADRWMLNNDRVFQESNGLFSAYNQSKRMLYDRWKKPGDVTDIPRYGVTPQLDSRFLEDASFLRLKNLMLSYTFPQKWLQRTNFLSSARIYAQGQNLLTFTSFTGMDPESTSNVYKAQYPMSRQFTFGLEVSF
ncbi:SusC/RagA family TonB-linked outer membrane protein, partial [Bacteroides xylanisolvens]